MPPSPLPPPPSFSPVSNKSPVNWYPPYPGKSIYQSADSAYPGPYYPPGRNYYNTLPPPVYRGLSGLGYPGLVDPIGVGSNPAANWLSNKMFSAYGRTPPYSVKQPPSPQQQSQSNTILVDVDYLNHLEHNHHHVGDDGHIHAHDPNHPYLHRPMPIGYATGSPSNRDSQTPSQEPMNIRAGESEWRRSSLRIHPGDLEVEEMNN
ncbi:unnamed protein product [Protopolystoma xenopodis]|uniref:Uncharacterized protein n=1 Tax=Protopolystoma xenopodis TaxID=117903 RepID=A0A3S5FET0_9PLAT|nr:unnamed protein product [Protopolystoma xenopodis]